MVISRVYVRRICVPVRFRSEPLFLSQDNIVVDEKGRASLCDFGMTTFIHSLDSINPSTQSSTGGTMQYMAPELVNPEDCGLKYAHPSCECDIYAFAVVMWQVCLNSHSWL